MRLRRIRGQAESGSVYHCISRTVGGQFLLDEEARERLVRMLIRQAGFCGVELVTWCMMSNHFHVLVRVPPSSPVDDGTILFRTEILYGKRGRLPQLIRQELHSHGAIPDGLRSALLRRMGDVSEFMKEFKQRFSRWFNRRHDRFGTLWAERFRSVLVEDQPDTLAIVAAYIDLNPVRAGIVCDPAAYRTCGHGAAIGGNATARRGLLGLMQTTRWSEAVTRYRIFMGTRAVKRPQAGNRAALLGILQRGGRLTLAEVLRLRLRHLTDGVVLGSREYVDNVFDRHRSWFGLRRRHGAHRIRPPILPFLTTLRDLRRHPVS